MKKQYIIPIFVPHLGCPNECVFCNQRSISGQRKNVTASDVKKTIEYYLKNFENDDTQKEVAFFGGSFTAIPKEKQEELLEAVQEYIENEQISSIRISTRPDAINKEILKFLKKYKVKTIELGVQTSNDYVLGASKRGHTFEDVKKASKLIKRYGFILGHQMMLGLPESSKEDDIKTARDLAKLRPKMVRIYPVLVIRNTELERLYNEDKYEPLTLEQAVEYSKELYYFFNKKRITIIRLGLQNSEEISNPKNAKSEVVAGPYHDAFRQLVEASIWYDLIVGKIKKLNVKAKEIELEVHPLNINNVMGHKRENAEKLKELYDVDIKVKSNDKFKLDKLEIKVLEVYP